ncbi:DUF4123 domain-containing protein [Cronobacter dublinensis]
MDTTALLAALPDGTDEKICLLFEAGAQSESDFLAFRAKHEHRLHSLYIHPQLVALQNYGPWLLDVDDKAQLRGFLNLLSGSVAVIAYTHHLPFLAIQLSRGCTIVSPAGSTALVRFYASHVIPVLAACTEHNWHASLFSGVTQWWLPGETQWQPISITPSKTASDEAPLIRLDNITWEQISAKPEVNSVLNVWQTMATSQSFPACAQRLMVIRALKKAASLGLEKSADRVLYALCYLNGGKKMLESETVCALLPGVIAGKVPLADVLLTTAVV